METLTRVAVVITKLTAGAGVVALNGALALDRKRFQVTLFYGAGDRLVEQARREGLATVQLEHMLADIAPRDDAQGVRELAAHLSGRFDLVHTHSAKAGAIGRLAARRAGLPVVHTLHGFPFHEFQSPLRRRVYVDIERRLARMTDMFLAVGSTVAADAIRLGIADPGRVRVIASSVDTDIPVATESARREARALLGLPAQVPVVGTVGRMDYQKAPEHFVEAARLVRNRDAHFVWIGTGTSADDIRRRVARSSLADRIVLAGERTDVPRLLPAFDVFAMSSRYEGIPCALAEAMLAGIPAVATAVNGVPELVIPGRTGLLARAGDPRSLAAAIDYALDRPEEAHRWSVEARERVLTQWAPAELATVLQSAYVEAMINRAVASNRVVVSLPRQLAPRDDGAQETVVADEELARLAGAVTAPRHLP